MLADTEPSRPADVPLRLLLADDIEPAVATDAALRLLLADADPDPSDALPVGDLGDPRMVELSASSSRATADFRLALE